NADREQNGKVLRSNDGMSKPRQQPFKKGRRQLAAHDMVRRRRRREEKKRGCKQDGAAKRNRNVHSSAPPNRGHCRRDYKRYGNCSQCATAESDEAHHRASFDEVRSRRDGAARGTSPRRGPAIRVRGTHSICNPLTRNGRTA